jgi:phosphoribosylformylglycinamidine synthase
MKFGVVVFPGSNCDHDCFHVLDKVCGKEVRFLWHRDADISGVDCIVLPGGFSYGDYLRAGAIASRSPILQSVVEFAKKGGYLIGICNGFQVLTETRLLPGALMQNNSLKFVCKDVHLKVENNERPFTTSYKKGDVVRVPIAHMDGNYFADSDAVKSMNDNGQVVFRYCNSSGEITDDANPNGSVENIAGICNKEGNVLGMMPHPERCSEDALTGVDGLKLFESLIGAIKS